MSDHLCLGYVLLHCLCIEPHYYIYINHRDDDCMYNTNVNMLIRLHYVSPSKATCWLTTVTKFCHNRWLNYMTVKTDTIELFHTYSL